VGSIYANIVKEDLAPRVDIQIAMTRVEYERFTSALDTVDSDDDMGRVLAKHVGPEFPALAQKYVFGVEVVDGPVRRRWRKLE
jgi:hypothetical protein